jgi:iron complex outermembrane receptor protein
MRGKTWVLGATALTATTLSFVATPAVAQDAAQAETSGITDIVVTAQRREQRLQDVPIAVTAFNQDSIEQLNARDIRDLTGLVPNLIVSEIALGPGLTQMSLRGVNSQDPEKSFDPAVGVFVDGVYLGTSAFNLLDSFDLERIEVLRGPQGTLFGRNTTGGAVQAFRTMPTGEFGVKGSAVVGSNERIDLQAVINTPLGENAGFKLSGFSFQDDGLWDNPAGGATGAEERWGLSARVAANFSPDLSVDVIYDYGKDESELTPYIPRGVGTFTPLPFRIVGTPPVPATITPGSGADRLCTIPGGRCLQRDFSQSTTTDPHEMDAEVHAGTATVNWALSDNLDLTAIVGHRQSEESVFIDFDGTDLTVFNVARLQEFQQNSAEVRVASDNEGGVNFVAGAFWYHSFYKLRQAIKLDASMVAPIPALGLVFVNASGDEDQHRATTTALFTQVDIPMAERFTVQIGGRITWDEKNVRTQFYNGPATLPPTRAAYSVAQGIPANRVLTSQGGASEDWVVFTPRIGVNYKASDDLLLYASAARGYNAGGFSARAGTVQTVTTPFDPEYINAYEAGFKWDFANGRGRLNAAAFFNDYSDKQEEVIEPGPPPSFTSTFVRNAASAQIFGLEFEASAILTDALRIDASLGLLNAEYEDFTVGVSSGSFASVPPQPPGTILQADLSGLSLRRTPDVTFSISPTYEASLGFGTLTLTGTGRYISEQYSEFFNDPRGLIPNQTFLDASATLAFGGQTQDRMRLTVFGENLTEEQDVGSYVNSIVDFGAVSAPRTYGVELQVRF